MLFDYYNALNERRGTEFETGPLLAGRAVWLDGCDGFFDQFFESKTPHAMLRFVVVEGRTPDTAEAVANLPLVQARILENRQTIAKVEITLVLPLYEWARNEPLGPQDRLAQIPLGFRPSAQWITGALDGGQRFKPGYPCHLVIDAPAGPRCLVLTRHDSSCYLVEL